MPTAQSTVTFSVKVRRGLGDATRLYDLLRPHATRIGSLTLDLHHDTVARLNAMNPLPFHSLIKFNAIVPAKNMESADGRGIIADAPSLSEFSLGHPLSSGWHLRQAPVFGHEAWNPPFAQLTVLNVVNAWIPHWALIPILSLSSQLVECRIWFDDYGRGMSLPPVTLPNLRVLDLTFCVMDPFPWNFLITPNLQDLTVTTSPDDYIDCWPAQAFIDFHARSAFKLRRLRLRLAQFFNQVDKMIAVLEMFPELDTLELRWMTYGGIRVAHDNAVVPLLQRMDMHSGNNQVLVPQLRTIQIDESRRCVDMLKSRCEPASSSVLETVVLYFHHGLEWESGSQSESGGDEDFSEDLEYLRERGIQASRAPMDYYGGDTFDDADYDGESSGQSSAPDEEEEEEEEGEVDEDSDAEEF
ncbi:hypothetical protein FB45DRAFT_919989 [Roridomyces roridus]|uniref:F-box domain-containing protein n=1 Tax=Roridomyces roridus TaxID=1738132 RepID=A0AAD7BS78_9AGAR|nr:hypothetical protein FB45DRAFT_919989 [Roridomyces roridus]